MKTATTRGDMSEACRLAGAIVMPANPCPMELVPGHRHLEHQKMHRGPNSSSTAQMMAVRGIGPTREAAFEQAAVALTMAVTDPAEIVPKRRGRHRLRGSG